MLQPALTRLLEFGAIGSGSRDEQLRRAILLLLSLTTTVAGTLWALSYLWAGLPHVAIVPFAYALIVLASIIAFLLTGRFALFAWVQLNLLFYLPFVCQWLLGGFVPGGGVMLWSILAVVGAFFFLGARAGAGAFALFVVFTVGSIVYDYWFRPAVLPVGVAVQSDAVVLSFTLSNLIGVTAVILAITIYALTEMRREQTKADSLLLNILPSPIAERMRGGETSIADSFEEVTILFADIVGFTRIAAGTPADNVVRLLNRLFTAFDEIAERWRVEKIKTIGDAYMVGAGLPLARDQHAAVIAEVALEMRDATERIAGEQGLKLELRIGVHTGPVVAGVIGLKRFAYDLWGDTVNLASRMESTAPAGAIQLSERTGQRLAGLYRLEPRAAVAVGSHGEIATFLLLERRDDVPDEGFPYPDVIPAGPAAASGPSAEIMPFPRPAAKAGRTGS